MKESILSPYRLIANAISVIDIATPLMPSVSPQEQLEAVWEEFVITEGVDPTVECLRLVRDYDHVFGYLDYLESFEAPLAGNAGDRAIPITPDMIVSASTPLLDMPSLFRKHYFFFVLTRNDITHFVSFQDMDKLLMKLCLFSLIMELEAKILELLMLNIFGHRWRPSIERYLGYLSKGRLEKARSLCGMKYGRESPGGILRCTTFIDKKQILRKDPEISSRLPFNSRRELDRFFKRVEDVRNQIAHSDSIIAHSDSAVHTLATPEKFNAFVVDLGEVTTAIGELYDEAVSTHLGALG